MAKMSPIQFQNEEKKSSICRVCLSYDACQSDKGLSLFEKFNDVFVFEKINYLASVEISLGDDLPDKICSDCHLALENACSFKQKCESSDAILHSAIKLNEPSNAQFIEVPIKEENEEDVEYDYLDENVLSHSDPEILQSVDVNPECTDIQPRNVTLECHDCGASFKSKCKLRVHWKKDHLPKKLTCPICKKILKSYKAFRNHRIRKSKTCLNASKLRVEGEGRSRVYHCKECNAHSKRIHTILTHLTIHTGDRPFKCNMCDKTFTQHSSMAGHKERAHKIYTKESTCSYCGKIFKGRTRFYSHMLTHSKVQYPCTVCSKLFKSKSILKQHMKRHSGVRAYTCEICAKSFYTGSELCNHKAKVHNEQKFYTCDICGYKTSRTTTMKKHRWMHSDHNVGCGVCGRFLDNQQQLLLHKRRHYEKNYQCTYCDKMYYGRKNLSAHIRFKHKMCQVPNGVRNDTKSPKVEVKPCSPSE